jgi:hypothetical protein
MNKKEINRKNNKKFKEFRNECLRLQKEWYKNLPNSDKDIFKEITGIDIEYDKTAKAMKLLKEKGYKIVKRK